MDKNIETKVRSIIKSIWTNIPIDEIGLEEDLTTYGINSLSFIRLVVALETEFGIEFDDQDLDIENSKTLRSLVSHIKNRI